MELCTISEARLVAILVFESISNDLTILNHRNEFIIPEIQIIDAKL